MLRNVFRAIAAALASIPKMIVTVCRTTGKLIVSLIPSSAPLTTSAGLEADDALQELRQSREENELFKPTLGKLVWAYAAAVVSRSTPPDVSHLPEGHQVWLEDLEPAACKRLLQRTEVEIERHLNADNSAHHLEGIPAVKAWPPRVTPVLDGSKNANAAGEAFVAKFWDELLNDLEGDPLNA